MSTATVDVIETITEVDIVRAWTDVEYRDSLTDEQLADLPASPIGDIEGISTEDFPHAGSIVSWLSPAGCFFTLACTGTCCAG